MDIKGTLPWLGNYLGKAKPRLGSIRIQQGDLAGRTITNRSTYEVSFVSFKLIVVLMSRTTRQHYRAS
jgi:hypothetical protein